MAVSVRRYVRRNPRHIPRRREIQPEEVFDITTTGMGWYDDLLENPEYFRRAKGVTGRIEYLSPNAYFNMIALATGVPSLEHRRVVEESYREKYVELMRQGVKFPIPVIDFERRTQEGRHRVAAAEKLGVRRIPVLIVRPIS